ncbi:hypothetical protein NDU88_001221 [Pleurodeles waltl]|uniref:Uncharacterized protein n=1 Tax=Pleurodeles waltl TaxID=8319 RepID=A0AAV7MJ45_PLEWA|nr:hypothetical protein NDU88_001221 [Pleurodeles waltl]
MSAALTLRPPRRYKQTPRRSPPTDRRGTMYRPHYYDRPIRHLFQSGFTMDKNTAETGILKAKNAHLYTLHEKGGHHGAGTPYSPCDSLPAPVPGAPTPVAKTTRSLPCAAVLDLVVLALFSGPCPVQRCLTWRSFIAQLGWGCRSFIGQLGCGWWDPPGQLGCGWRDPPGQRRWGWRWSPGQQRWGWRWPPGMMAVFSAALDLPAFFWPFPTLGGVTAESTLPPVPLGAAWVA